MMLDFHTYHADLQSTSSSYVAETSEFVCEQTLETDCCRQSTRSVHITNFDRARGGLSNNGCYLKVCDPVGKFRKNPYMSHKKL